MKEININLIKELLDKETRNGLVMELICSRRAERVIKMLREDIIDVDQLFLQLQKYYRSKEKYYRISGEENTFSVVDEYIGLRIRRRLTI